MGNTTPIEKLVKDVNKQFTNEIQTTSKHKMFFGVLDQTLHCNGGKVFSVSLLYYSLLTRKYQCGKTGLFSLKEREPQFPCLRREAGVPWRYMLYIQKLEF